MHAPRYWYLLLILSVSKLNADQPIGAKQASWCPSLDQSAQIEWEGVWNGKTYAPGSRPYNDPDFTYSSGPDSLGPPFPKAADIANVKVRIATSIQIAYAKGFRVIDLLCWPLNYDASKSNWADQACKHATEYWLDAIKKFNASGPRQMLKIRVRIANAAASGTYLMNLYRRDPTKYNKQFGSDTAFYSFVNAHLTTLESDGSTDPFVDISNDRMRQLLRDYTKYTIDDVRGYLAGSRVAIEEVTLGLDGGGESSLYAYNSNNSWIEFPGGKYADQLTFRAKADYFEQRQSILHNVYIDFARVVHSYADSSGNPLKAAIFYQTWYFDDYVRGAFDLYSLLKGSEIDILHACDFVVWITPGKCVYPASAGISYADHLKVAAFSALCVSQNGMTFDMEFSWAHYKYDCTNSTQYIGYDASQLTQTNAISFYDQARAALKYDATTISFCNWLMCTIRHEAPQLATSDWFNILGNKNSTSPVFDDRKFFGTNGLLVSPLADPLPKRSSKAIYISTYGRMDNIASHTTNNLRHGPEVSNSVISTDYCRWFDNFNLTSMLPFGRIDVITDGMIEDGKVPWSQYDRIFIPYELSKVTGSKVYAIINSLGGVDKAKFRYQRAKDDSVSALKSGISDWMANTMRYEP